VIRALRSFAAFWYDFLIGDDWRIAAGVALALAVTALLVYLGVSAWWVLPVAVLRTLRARTGAPPATASVEASGSVHCVRSSRSGTTSSSATTGGSPWGSPRRWR